MPEVSTLDTLKQTQKNSTTDKTENLKKMPGPAQCRTPANK